MFLLLQLLLCNYCCYFFIAMQINQKLHMLDMPPAAASTGAVCLHIHSFSRNTAAFFIENI